MSGTRRCCVPARTFDSDSDKVIDLMKSDPFTLYPEHAYNSRTHRQGGNVSEAADQ